MLPGFSPAAAAIAVRLAPAQPCRATSAAAASRRRCRVRSPLVGAPAVDALAEGAPGRASSVDAAVMTLPVALAQRRLDHLAGGAVRQHVHPVHAGRALEPGQLT